MIGSTGGGTYLASDAVARDLTMTEEETTAPEVASHTSLVANRTFKIDISGWSAGEAAFVARSKATEHDNAASSQFTHTASANSGDRY